CPHHVDRVEAGALAARQRPPKIQAPNPHQHGEHAPLLLHARRVAISTEQAAALQRLERAAITVLADPAEDDVKPAWTDTREVLAFVVNRCGAQLADQRRVFAARGAPQFEITHPAEREERLTDGARGSLHKHALASPHPGRAV